MLVLSKIVMLSATFAIAGAVPVAAAASTMPLTVNLQNETYSQQIFGYVSQTTAPFDLVQYGEDTGSAGQLEGFTSLNGAAAGSSVMTNATRAPNNRSGSGSIVTFNEYTHDPDLVGGTFAGGLYRFEVTVDQHAFFFFNYSFSVQGDLPDVFTLADFAVTTDSAIVPVALEAGQGSFDFALDANTRYFVHFYLMSDHFRQSGSPEPRMTSQATLRFDYTVSPTVSAIPEPASWALMIAGFGLAGSAIRQRIFTTTIKGSARRRQDA